MSSFILGALVGIVVGVFIPSPMDATIKGWFVTLWDKISSLWKKDETPTGM